MAKNRVQIQRGISFSEFQKQFDLNQCRPRLASYTQTGRFVCPETFGKRSQAMRDRGLSFLGAMVFVCLATPQAQAKVAKIPWKSESPYEGNPRNKRRGSNARRHLAGRSVQHLGRRQPTLE